MRSDCCRRASKRWPYSAQNDQVEAGEDVQNFTRQQGQVYGSGPARMAEAFQTGARKLAASRSLPQPATRSVSRRQKAEG
jgi:hypothetical protein